MGILRHVALDLDNRPERWVQQRPDAGNALGRVNPTLAFARAPSASAWAKQGEAVATVLCAIFVGAGWLAHRAGLGAVGTVLIFLVGYVLGGYPQAIEVTTTLLKDRELDVDPLMVVAAIGAAVTGYWFDGAILILSSR